MVSLLLFTLLGSEYKTAITFQLVGYFGEILGLKATLYNPEYSDKGGLFYCVFNQFHKHDPEEKVKKLLIALNQKGYLEKF